MAPSTCPSTFEDYVYSNLSAVFIDPASEAALDFDLLDVLVKTDTKSGGFVGFLTNLFRAEPDPVLVHLGSMGKPEVGTYSDPADGKSLHDGLSQFGKCTREKLAHPEDTLFKWKPSSAEADKREFGLGPGLKLALESAGILQAGVDFSNSQTLKVHIEKMEVACVNKHKIINLVEGLRWKPTKKVDKLWVVHQILFASKVEVTSSTSASTDAKFKCTFFPSSPGGSVGSSSKPPNQTKLDWSVPSPNSTYPGKIMFAFRVLSFQFNDAGTCVKVEERIESQSSFQRGDSDDEDEQSHIRDLFLNPPLGDDESDEEENCLNLQPLLIKKCPAAAAVPAADDRPDGRRH